MKLFTFDLMLEADMDNDVATGVDGSGLEFGQLRSAAEWHAAWLDEQFRWGENQERQEPSVTDLSWVMNEESLSPILWLG